MVAEPCTLSEAFTLQLGHIGTFFAPVKPCGRDYKLTNELFDEEWEEDEDDEDEDELDDDDEDEDELDDEDDWDDDEDDWDDDSED
jgi:hypothetical protein